MTGHRNPPRCYLQISDMEACREALSSQLSNVIIAQVQGFHRKQLPSPPAINTANLIMMSEK